MLIENAEQNGASQLTGRSPAWPPFRIEPAFYARPWGSATLKPWYDPPASRELFGEVWLNGIDCRVTTGPHTGKTLADLAAQDSASLLGSAAELLLVKMIFAQQKLSVQVHPDDAMARRYGAPRGKTECWYALQASPDAQVALGLKPGMTLEQLREDIAWNTLEAHLQTVPVSRGDLLLVEAGTIHAIWPGSVLLEVQQYCDLTYRLYDYGRPRELHIEKVLEAIQLDAPAIKVPPQSLPGRTLLVETPYFRLERIELPGSLASSQLAPGEPRALQYLFVAAGRARIAGSSFEAFELPAGALAAVPAATPEFSIEDLGGLELIRIR